MVPGTLRGSDSALYHAEAFQEVLHRETARSLRSGRTFLLVLIDVSRYILGERLTTTRQIASVLSSSTREIDTKGWYAEDTVLGVLFTEFGSMRDSVDAAGEAIARRLYTSLSSLLGHDAIRIALYTLPTRGITFETLSSHPLVDLGAGQQFGSVSRQ
jgi:hypothetical protein